MNASHYRIKMPNGAWLTVKKFPDRCWAVVIGSRRGPVAPDRPRAVARYMLSGLIADVATDTRKLKMDARNIRLRRAARQAIGWAAFLNECRFHAFHA